MLKKKKEGFIKLYNNIFLVINVEEKNGRGEQCAMLSVPLNRSRNYRFYYFKW
jgi:hypothetical protein